MLSRIPVPLLGGSLTGPSSDLDWFKGYNCCHVIDGNEVVGLLWVDRIDLSSDGFSVLPRVRFW